MKNFTVLACLAALVVVVASHTAEEWKSRVIYQILTDRFAKNTDDDSPCADLKYYCGGTFNGIIRKLDYLQGLGVNAIWISPIPENTDNGYHGYWQKNIYKVNSHFGTSEDLHRLIKECHDRDIWVMLDVVGNHMGYQGQDPNDFSMFTPFNKPEHYHNDCPLNNYDNQNEVENCRLAGLPDLDQSNNFVVSKLTQWVQDTVKEYGFDGLRVDTTHMVSKEFWYNYSKSSGVYTVGEVFSRDPYYISGYQGTALDALLDYSMLYYLKDVFMYKQHMGRIHDGVEGKKIFPDSTVLASFLDNHDNNRVLNVNRDWTLLKNALAYIVFAEGIPVIYYGTEQGFTGGHDPENRESLWPHYNTGHWLYMYISTIVKFRVKQGDKLYGAKQVERYVDEHFFAFSRGKIFVATTNVGSGGSLSRTISFHQYKDGTKLQDILRPSYITTVKEGKFTVSIYNGQPRIYHPTDLTEYKESGVCYEDGDRKDCGFVGIDQEKCEEKACCWSPVEGKNWCFQKTKVKEADGREEL